MLTHLLHEARDKLQLNMKELAHLTGIDQALISKIENGKRLPTDKQLRLLTDVLCISYLEGKKLLLSEKVYNLLRDEEMGYEAWMVTEPRLEYLKSGNANDLPNISPEILAKLNRIDHLRKTWFSLREIKGLRRDKMNEYFSISYTYESNKIEGNTLTLSETKLVIKDGITISGKSLDEHLEAINHAEAIDLMYDFADDDIDLNKRVLLDFHSLILRGINKDFAGRYRNVPVRISGSEHIPAQPFLIEKLMEDYFLFYQQMKDKIHPAILAAEMHERLVTIHPFLDGNGRTSRLVMNLILVSCGYPIAI